MDDRYEIGLAVVGSRVALVFRRGERVGRRVVFESGAPHAHAAAVEGVCRAASEPLARPLPRVVYLRQRSVIGTFDLDDALASVLFTARTSIVWSSAKAPDGEHGLVAEAAALAAQGVTT